MLSVVGKIYAGILVDRVRRLIGGLIDDEQVGFRPGRGFVNQIGEKARGKKRRVYVSFIILKKGYDRANKEALW